MPTKILKLPKTNDIVNNPKHYLCPHAVSQLYVDDEGNYYIEAISVIKAWGYQTNAWIFNVLKYILRAGKKDDQSLKRDFRKSRYYLDEAIAELPDDEETQK